AINPLMIPTARTVHRALERWADENAASDVGDRGLVARAVGRSALLIHAAHARALVLGAAAEAVPERVRALLSPAPRPRPVSVAVLLTLLVATASANAVVQHDADQFFDRAHIADVRDR